MWGNVWVIKSKDFRSQINRLGYGETRHMQVLSLEGCPDTDQKKLLATKIDIEKDTCNRRLSMVRR